MTIIEASTRNSSAAVIDMTVMTVDWLFAAQNNVLQLAIIYQHTHNAP